MKIWLIFTKSISLRYFCESKIDLYIAFVFISDNHVIPFGTKRSLCRLGVLTTKNDYMRFLEEDYALFPVKDFADNSPLLQRLNWSSRLMASLIRAKVSLDGHYDSNFGGWLTSKHAILQSFAVRNKGGMAQRIDLVEAYDQISPVKIIKKATG